ncbi:MAG TPA: hypothetical protein VFA48_03780 [Gammaproteobacteria bacterium]|nr:hypothetical protein [Gammaproteobacteria bacterium]
MKHSLRLLLGFATSLAAALALAAGSASAATRSGNAHLLLAQNDASNNSKIRVAECVDQKACQADWERHYERIRQQEEEAIQEEQKGIEMEQRGIEMQQKALEERQQIMEEEEQWFRKQEGAGGSK